ncbi:hypothetical protein EW146_g7704 [Bondarzewia mesenterica]|uniref:Uncharacterized protein n=1 Tax=Bondarzewia mesenterica TaxID=1095465 RepID=A0A4S4LK76_9AGAM|nr:hypothetical protein EW146_g7704 [Bondarzewia mesenterica]
MTGNAISSGTLNLRFMQNARRNQELAAQSDGAEEKVVAVQDESFWEVSKEVKEAWGIGARSQTSTSSSTTHEPSYLPFLFSSASPTEGLKVKGRRTWNKHGQEIIESESKPDPEPPSTDPSERPKSNPTSLRRLTSISRSSYSTSTDSAQPRPSKSKSHSKPTSATRQQKQQTARDVIRESGNVGVDLRARPSSSSSSFKKDDEEDTKRFRKPAGVDDPMTRGDRDAVALKRVREEQEGREGEGEDEGKKRKKKKNRVIV